MNSKVWLPLVGTLLLCGCAPRSATPDGGSLLDDEVALERNGTVDIAHREIAVDADSVLVAFVDENLTDVKLRLEVTGGATSSAPVEVENDLLGAGLEIAAIRAPRGSRLKLTLTNPRDAAKPGTVHLRVRRFDAPAGRSAFAEQVAAFQLWSSATNAGFRADSIRSTALRDIDGAIEKLDSPRGDARLAAAAHLVKSNMFEYFKIDWRGSREEARRARDGFAKSTPVDALGIARADFMEARSLRDIALDFAAVNPTCDDARTESRRILEALAKPDSPFGPIERARTLSEIGYLDMDEGFNDRARARFDEAKTVYHDAGYDAGERRTRFDIARAFVQSGRFSEAAQAFEKLFPEIDRFSNPDDRVYLLTFAARSQGFGGHSDEALEKLTKAIAEARKYQLRSREGEAIQELSYIYWNRGDMPQTEALLAENLRLSRDDPDTMKYVYAVDTNGSMARFEGNFEKAIEMHKEAARHSSSPIERVRVARSLGQDYAGLGRHQEAIAEYRRALAIPLDDPHHHAYSDVKRSLAAALIEHGDGKPATLDEAEQLLEQAIKRCREVHDVLGEFAASLTIAQLLTKRHQPKAAMEMYRLTFDQIFNYRGMSTNAELNTTALSFEQPAFRGYFDLVMRDLAAAGGRAPRRATPMEERALRMLELARQSHFGAVRAAQLDPATQVRVDALLTQMADKSLQISTLTQRDPETQGAERLASLQIDMSRLRAQVDEERIAAAVKQRKAAGPSIAEHGTWRSVGRGVVQLSYAMGNDRAYVWTRTASGTQVAMLDERPEQLESRLVELAALDAQRDSVRIEQSLAALSSALLPPKLLPADSRAVEIVAEGRLASVPFAGLRSPIDPSRRLVETHAITMITSLFAPAEPSPPGMTRPFRLLALASGHGTLRSAHASETAPRLQAATAEIRAVADLFTASDQHARIKLFSGSDGSADALRGMWSGGVDVVHFATHSLADLRNPLASLLVLPPRDPQGNATYLTAGQVQSWHGDVGLVFLSACESAVGPPRFAGGMPGLQSSFLRAGAQGVIATLWPIEDVLARDFSVDFYRRFAKGQSAVESLRETQREWLTAKAGLSEDEQTRRRITALAHEFYMR